MSIGHRIIHEGAEEERLPGIIPENDDDGDGDEIIIERRRSILSGGSSSVGEEELEIPDQNYDVIIGTRTPPLQLSSGFDCGNNFTISSSSSSSSKIVDDGLPSISASTTTTTRNKNNCTSASSTTNKRHTFLVLVGLMATVTMTMTMTMVVLLSSSSSLSVPLSIKNYLSLKKQQSILLPKNNFNSVKDQNKKDDSFLSPSHGQYQHQFRKRHRRFLQEEDDLFPEIEVLIPPGVDSTNTSALNELSDELTAANVTNGSNIVDNGNGTVEPIPIANDTTDTVDPEPPIVISTNITLLPNSTLLPTIQTVLPTIIPTLPPTTLPTQHPNITSEQNESNNTLTPTIILNETVSPSSVPSMPPTVSFQPTISSEPSDLPSVTRQPTYIPSKTPTFRPSLSHAPSISNAPSSAPSNSPTTKPPSVHPSESPSKSAMPTNIPSDAPTEFPTISLVPSSVPTASHEPSVSLFPSIPTLEIKTYGEIDIEMILENVPPNLTSEQIKIWQNVTSDHLLQYYEDIEDTFPEDWPIHIMSVQTTLQDQMTVDTPTDNDDNLSGIPPNDEKVEGEELAPPLIEAATARKETITLNITYTQNVTYTTNLSNITDSEVFDRLFVIPFQTDSFTYSISLINAMNWSTFVNVRDVTPGETEPEPDPTSAPTENENDTGALNSTSTFAISGSIILAACLIVAFLLWERVHKGDPNAMMFADRRGDASTTSSIGGIPHHHQRFESTGGIQGDLATMSEHDIGGLPMEMYSINRHNNNFNKNSILTGGGENNNSNSSDGEEIINSSIRSAPIMSTIRRSEVQQRLGGRGVLTPNTNTNSAFISRTNHTHTSGVTNSSSSSSKTMGERSVENDDSDPYRSSPGIPQQIPISSRNDSNHSGGGRSSSGSYNSVNNRNNNNNNDRLHPLPPLPPPPRSFEPPRQFDHVDSTNTLSAAHFGRPSVRRSPFGMRVSSITDSSITDFSYLSDAFRMDREYSDDQLNDAPELPPISDHVYVFYYYFKN
jgi:hypothetical protein